MKSVSAAAGRRPRTAPQSVRGAVAAARASNGSRWRLGASVGRSVGGAAFVPAIRPLSLPLAAAFIVARHSTTRARALGA